MAERSERLDRATQAVLAALYPTASRPADARRLGYKRAMLDHICSGKRFPKPDAAQIISADSGGRLSMAHLCGWTRKTRYPGCRVFEDDPMPPARAEGTETFRNRASDHDAILYLRSVAAELAPEVREAVETLLGLVEAPVRESAS